MSFVWLISEALSIILPAGSLVQLNNKRIAQVVEGLLSGFAHSVSLFR